MTFEIDDALSGMVLLIPTKLHVDSQKNADFFKKLRYLLAQLIFTPFLYSILFVGLVLVIAISLLLFFTKLPFLLLPCCFKKVYRDECEHIKDLLWAFKKFIMFPFSLLNHIYIGARSIFQRSYFLSMVKKNCKNLTEDEQANNPFSPDKPSDLICQYGGPLQGDNVHIVNAGYQYPPASCLQMQIPEYLKQQQQCMC